MKSVDCDIVDNNNSYTKKYQEHIPCSFAHKVVCDNNCNKKLICAEEKMLFMNLLSQFLKSIIIVEVL